MNPSQLESLLLWWTIFDYGIVILWWLLMLTPHQWLYCLSTKNLKLTEEQFDGYCFIGIVFFKVCIVVFNLVPLLALHIAFG